MFSGEDKKMRMVRMLLIPLAPQRACTEHLLCALGHSRHRDTAVNKQLPRAVVRVHEDGCPAQAPHTGQLWGKPGPQCCPVGGIQPQQSQL